MCIYWNKTIYLYICASLCKLYKHAIRLKHSCNLPILWAWCRLPGPNASRFPSTQVHLRHDFLHYFEISRQCKVQSSMFHLRVIKNFETNKDGVTSRVFRSWPGKKAEGAEHDAPEHPGIVAVGHSQQETLQDSCQRLVQGSPERCWLIFVRCLIVPS